MQDQQNALKAAFPNFIDTIQNALPTTDYHIMVVDTDAAGRCSPQTCSHSTCQEADQYACGNQFVACDTIRGAGVTHPAGQGATNAPCVLQGGNRYIVEGQPDLPATFECIASVGLAGNASERPLDGLVESVSAPLQGAGGCTEGFLRDDAILVVVVLTDDPPYDPDFDDAHPGTDTSGWYDAIVAAKNGNPEAMVVIGFVPWSNLSCVVFGIESPNLINFVQSFGDQGVLASICENDFGPIFSQAVETIVTTCESFDPPG
jgi:hypothetical protein